MRSHPKTSRALLAVVLFVTLVAAVGCSHGGHQRGLASAPAKPALTTGYDPAWSPDGSRIAYVQARFLKGSSQGLWLDTAEDVPLGSTPLCVWDLDRDTRERIEPDNQRRPSTSLVWMGDDRLVFAATEVGEIDRQAPRFRGRWHWLPIYRDSGLAKWVVECKLAPIRSDLPQVALAAPLVGIEPGRNSSDEIALWEYRRLPGAGHQHVLACETMNAAGQVIRKTELPPIRGTGHPEATMRAQVPVVARQTQSDFRLAQVRRGRLVDFYCTRSLVLGVYGSPDGLRVAFHEALPGSPPSAGMALRVIPISGGTPVTVTDDAWPWSHVAWSPDGAKVAYTRATDGRVVIADVRAAGKQHGHHAESVSVRRRVGVYHQSLGNAAVGREALLAGDWPVPKSGPAQRRRQLVRIRGQQPARVH